MAISTAIKNGINGVLRPLNARLESLTSDCRETVRLESLVRRGHFAEPVFPVLPALKAARCQPILERLASDRARFGDLLAQQDAFALDNAYFTTPDAEVLYSVVQMLRPSRVIEVGSGNSTLLLRLSAADANPKLAITSIDPWPRRSVEGAATKVIKSKVENGPLETFDGLGAGDILFIDSSHEIRVGNDVLLLFLSVLPRLRSGVMIHIHDVFLPYEYPQSWLVEKRWNWTEQYLLQALLSGNREYEVWWPGQYLQRSMENFTAFFPAIGDNLAKSFWMMKR